MFYELTKIIYDYDVIKFLRIPLNSFPASLFSSDFFIQGTL
jgi:hypothetical protein